MPSFFIDRPIFAWVVAILITLVGTISVLNEDDAVITAYRDHAHAIARGMDCCRGPQRL